MDLFTELTQTHNAERWWRREHARRPTMRGLTIEGQTVNVVVAEVQKIRPRRRVCRPKSRK